VADVKISGRAGLQDALDRVVSTVDAEVAGVVRESADALIDGTRERVAHDTGNLHDSLDAVYAPDGLSADVGWFDPGDFYADFVEHGTSSQPAQPALTPAAEQERRMLPKRVEKHVGTAVRRIRA